MPPKAKITRNEIIRAAVEIVRTSGEQALNARAVANNLGCSTQPVFSNFSGMEELREAVIDEAEKTFEKLMANEISSGKYPAYKASGMAYIRFASEERELFNLLYMRDRSSETIPSETALGNQMNDMVKGNTGLGGNASQLFHLEMWICVHGIASMIATNYLSFEENLISSMLTDIYQGLKMRFEQKE